MKKGFTLIELLSVIAILAIIILIALPSVLDILENAKIKAYQDNELMMNKAAAAYLAANEEFIPKHFGESISIELSTLQNNELISDIKNCSGYINVIKKVDSSTSYNPVLNCGIEYQTLEKYIEDGLVINFDGEDKPVEGKWINRINNGIDGIINGATYIESKKAYSLFLDDRIEILNPISSQSPSNQDWAVETVARINSKYIDDYDFLLYGLNKGLRFSHRIKPLLYLNDGLEDYYDYANYNLADDNIYHIVFNFKYDGDLVEIFINNVDYSYTGARRVGRIPSGIENTLYIGHNSESEIYNFRFYNRHLSHDEIEHNFNIEKKRFGL